MRTLGGFGIAAALVAATAGCTINPEPLDEFYKLVYDFDAVRTMQPQGPEFNRGLRAQYIRYADTEDDENDFSDWYHFMDKALVSANGYEVLPDTAEARDLRRAYLTAPGAATARDIAGEGRAELTDARARLMTVLDAGARREAPAQAAIAQAAFDCWLEQVEEDSPPEEVAACKAYFEEALAGIDLGEEGMLYLVFFAWDQAELSPVGQRVIDQIIADYHEGRPVQLVVAGHADRSGAPAYNLRLSELRARNVAERLAAGGVPPSEITVQWFGETQPRVPTPDDVREPQNRRVEVTFIESGAAVPPAGGIALVR